MSKPLPSRVRVGGPLGSYAPGFRRELSGLGYSSSPAAGHLQLMAHLSCWLDDHGLGVEGLTVGRVEEFLEDRRSCGRVHRRLTLGGLSPLLGYLRGLGVAPLPVSPDVGGPLAELVEEFTGYLREERGLAEGTVANYRKVAKSFLSLHVSDADCGHARVSGLVAEDVVGFMLVEANRSRGRSLGVVAVGLRVLLRFLYLGGYTATSLAEAVPAAPGWSGSARLPRATEAAQVARLLASCDRRTNPGRRDFAVLTVLARLGLRAGEVAALTVDDFEWEAGELVVRGKGGRRDRLPLPHDVGRAVADYCSRGRRRGECRSLFLHARAPYGAISSSAVGEIVARACERAGMARIGSHQLRHGAATAMRRAGAPLFEIGQVLRHRHTATTAHYARDDVAALAVVARPWLGGPR